ncbi:9245_t:CDS:2, partial [Gigaspora rosea]
MSHCCRSRTYFFEIRKCQAAETGCMICKPPRTNEDHYMPFYEIYGKDTTENYRPSLLQKANASKLSSTSMTINSLGINSMGFSPRAQYAANIRVLVKCIECNRPRVLYSQYRLNSEEENFLKNFIETIDYTCGTTFYGISDLAKANSSLFLDDGNFNTENDLIELHDINNSMHEDDDNDINNSMHEDDDNDINNSMHEDDDNDVEDVEDYDETVDELSTEQQNNDLTLETLFSHVFVNAKLTCLTPMEVSYFSSHLYPDVCFQCGDPEILLPIPVGQQPYCFECNTTVETKKRKGK